MTKTAPDPDRKKIYCEKYHCFMFALACINRQTKKHSWGGVLNPRRFKVNHSFTYPECAKCKQGKEILAEYQKSKRKEDKESG